jgi:hypothetical protein
MLKLHKSLVDSERQSYENVHGAMTAGQFLNVLIEDEDLAWLRRFSMLIVEIDELFDLKDGYTAEMVEASLKKVVNLVRMSDDDQYFNAKYLHAIQTNVDAAAGHSDLKNILSIGENDA